LFIESIYCGGYNSNKVLDVLFNKYVVSILTLLKLFSKVRLASLSVITWPVRSASD
jgi:hypothetical protein